LESQKKKKKRESKNTMRNLKKKKIPLKNGSTHVTRGLTRPVILRVRYGLILSLFPGRKTPTHTHIFPSGLGKKIGLGQILPGLILAQPIMPSKE
jgi:hypothetical protein